MAAQQSAIPIGFLALPHQ